MNKRELMARIEAYIRLGDYDIAFALSLDKQYRNDPDIVWLRFQCYDLTNNYVAFLRWQLFEVTGEEQEQTQYKPKLKGKNNTMPEVKFTQEDLLERTQLQPTWYPLTCKSVDEGPGKTDPSSIVYTCIFVVDDGPSKGVPIRHWFSEKAMGRIVDYIRCFLPGGKVEAGKVYDLAQTVGLKLDGYCQYDIGQGYNVIKDWRPSKQAAKTASDGGKK